MLGKVPVREAEMLSSSVSHRCEVPHHDRLTAIKGGGVEYTRRMIALAEEEEEMR